jgi:hypothetical protein
LRRANGLDLTGVVAIDGKAVRGAYERGGQATPLQLVNVFAVEARMALAQRKAPDRNGTTGALEMLDGPRSCKREKPQRSASGLWRSRYRVADR